MGRKRYKFRIINSQLSIHVYEKGIKAIKKREKDECALESLVE